MGKTLVVAEKPAVGRDLARVLGCKQKKEGFINGDEYVVSWCMGHLVTLCEPEDYDPRYKKWSLQTLPIIPSEMKLKVVKGVKDQFNILEMLMNSTEISYIVCATDAGREGELIFRYVYHLAGCEKPFQRLWISSMVDSAIKEGFRQLKPGNDFDDLYESARCRSEADWLVGINATRAYTVRQGGLLSVGRVQTPTLAILVNRQREIDNFISQDYWEIIASYENFHGFWFDPEAGVSRTYQYEKAEEIAGKVKGETGYITQIKEEAKKELPPQLYDLNELQRDANKKYGFSAKKTLSIAQDLYEKYKVITYPRTDSRYLTSDMESSLKNLIKKVGETGEELKPHADYIMSLSRLPITRRIIDDKKVSDHHAIIPTGKKAKLPADALKVYTLVALRLMAAFYPEYRYKVTTITVEVAGEIFVSRGKIVQQEGWKEVYKEKEENSGKSNKSRGAQKGEAQKEDSSEDTAKDEEQVLPHLNERDAVQVVDTEVHSKKTRPPTQYTEAGLLAAMENAGRFVEDEELKDHLKDRGLGTPATRASIIERLLTVGYVQRKRKKLVPTNKGMDLIKIVPEQLKSPEMTGEWEQELNEIARGQSDPENFLEKIKEYTAYVVKEARSSDIVPELREKKKNSSRSKNADKKINENTGEVLGKCPSCGEGEVVVRSRGYGCSRWKDGCEFFVSAVILGKELSTSDVKRLLQDGKTELLKGFTSKKGKKFNARLALEEGGQIQFKFN